MQVTAKRKDSIFYPDHGRVIARFLYTSNERSKNIIRNVLELSDKEVDDALSHVLREYSKKHRSISRIFKLHYNKLSALFEELDVNITTVESKRKALIGSYFTKEYSIESAAFFNPSVVEDPSQSNVGPGEKRVILSFRATGEGHISSIVFRSAIIDKEGTMVVQPVGNMLAEADRIKMHRYKKKTFIKELKEIYDHEKETSFSFVLDKCDDNFTYSELKNAVEVAKSDHQLSLFKKIMLDQIMWLARSHYEIDFSLDSALSERVIFPIAKNEKNGIEDARFVKFIDDDGQVMYYATYTAYDGNVILSKLLQTKDFYHFKGLPVHGELVHNKGMALFPRKIKGQYAMLCRIDGASNYLSYSDNINIWNEAKLIQKPIHSWEMLQVGNCGSPVETDEGWLIITHGVGPMREYVLGASLHDLDNPEMEIGRLKTPLLVPNAEERRGYVPNVVYSCGSIIHNGNLIIPYAMSDYASTYASVDLSELLYELKKTN